MKPAQAVAFDLDGTLIDSRLDIAAACNHVLVAAGRAALPPEIVAGFVGDGVRMLLGRAFSMATTDPALDALEVAFVKRYAAHAVERTTWMPGALEALDALAHLPLALVTNKARAVTLEVLEGLHATQRFAFVYAGGDGPLKPRAEPVLSAATALGVPVDALWMVGDGPQDIQAAHAAGAVAVGVAGGFTPELRLHAAGPDVALRSLTELPERVKSAG